MFNLNYHSNIKKELFWGVVIYLDSFLKNIMNKITKKGVILAIIRIKERK